MHACAAINWRRKRPEEFCNHWLTLGAYNATYQFFFIKPTHGAQYWTPTEYEKPQPPNKKSQRGRPKKMRRKDTDEELISRKNLKRQLVEWTCSKCGLNGHNKR